MRTTAAFFPRPLAGAFLAGAFAGAFLDFAGAFFLGGGTSESGSSKSDPTPASMSIIMESSDCSLSLFASALAFPWVKKQGRQIKHGSRSKLYYLCLG